MTQLNWNDIKRALESVLLGSLPTDLQAPSGLTICTDSRTSLKHKWFLPIKGERFDGHSFIVKALTEQGALGAFCEESSLDLIPKNLHHQLVVVSHTLEALQRIAAYIRSLNKKLIAFGITGSVGKTTCKNMLSSILSNSELKTLVPPKNYNNEIGLPLSLLQLQTNHDHAVMEMGARRRGDISFLKSIAQTSINVCLNVGSSHIGVFGSKENIYEAKLEIIQNSKEGDVGLVFGDDPKLVEKARSYQKDCYTYGYSSHCDAQITEERVTEENTLHLKMRLFKSELEVSLPCIHKTFAINALAAAFMAHLAGLSLKNIRAGLEKFKTVESRFKPFVIGNTVFIDDSYNASLESMISGIKTLALCYPKLKPTLVLGDMLDLGSYSKELHNDLASFCLKQEGLKKIVLIGATQKEAFSKLPNKKEIPLDYYQDVSAFLENNPKSSSHGDLVYLKGSNALNLKKVIETYLKN